MLCDQPEASQVLLGPARADEEIADDIGGLDVARSVIVDHDHAPISMLIDPLASSACRKLKALVFKGSDNAPR